MTLPKWATSLLDWTRTNKWAPATPGGGSSGWPVELAATGELGHAKPTEIAAELLASRLGKLVGMPVPDVELGQSEGKVVAVAKLWGAQSMDVPMMQQKHAAHAVSQPFKDALKAASRICVFHAWIGTPDLKDAHVVVRPGTAQGTYEMGYIDYAWSFAWPAGGGTVAVPTAPPALVQARDAGVTSQAITDIEAVPQNQIETIVQAAVPDDVLSQPEKARVATGLLARRSDLRNQFRRAGWIP